MILHRGAVALLPLVDDDRICLIENHRYTIGKTLLEIPAGTIDPGESPEQTARRELTEETGYVAGSIEKIREWYVSPGVMNERMYLFACRNLQPGPTQIQPDETLAPRILTWDEALAQVDNGQIEDAKTILALLLGQKLRGEFRT